MIAECEVRTVGIGLVEHIADAERQGPLLAWPRGDAQVREIVPAVARRVRRMRPIVTDVQPLKLSREAGRFAPQPQGMHAARRGVDVIARRNLLALFHGRREAVLVPRKRAGCLRRPALRE